MFGGKVVRQISPKRVKVPSFSPHMWGVDDKRNEDGSVQEREDVPHVLLVVPRLRKDKAAQDEIGSPPRTACAIRL